MLNLISDPWIPVRRVSGPDIIRPDQIAEPDVLFPDWPRPDLNLACLELLVGLVYLAAPPGDISDWMSRAPDPEGLRRALAPLTSAFNLTGDGPLFLQDFEPIEGNKSSPDMLFIDSAGGSTAKKNADLMVKRGRYPSLPLSLSAMALYTLQNFAPSGGAGNRTSMRGGGPMVTLIRPQEPGLWPLIWANVPVGEALGPDELDELPWMRPTETSKNGEVAIQPGEPGEAPVPEVFFGQPRRLKLVVTDDRVTSVVQTPGGTNYQGWIHPLSPYYHIKNEVLPKHPKPGRLGYRNWHGTVLQSDGVDRPQCLLRFMRHRRDSTCSLLVGGWAMDKWKPLDFIWSELPVFALDPDGDRLAEEYVTAAEVAGYEVAGAVSRGTGEDDISSGAGNRAREAFFAETQTAFEALLRGIAAGQKSVGADWLKEMRQISLDIFDAEVLPGLADLAETRRKNAVEARKDLTFAFAGYGKNSGVKLYNLLQLEPPKQKRKQKAGVEV